jgi:hypothetical protein
MLMELPLDANMALTDLPFGSSKSNVRAFFGGEPQPFRRTPTSREGDYWADLGVFASYDDAETLEALELAATANPCLSGQALTSLPLQSAKQLLRRVDDALEEESDGAISKKVGISIWSGAGMHGMVQAVLRFKPGYYD